MDEIPIVEVTLGRAGGQAVSFYCQYCREKHTHGAAAGGHRQAHCSNPNSPYKKTGYILKIAGEAERDDEIK